MSRALNHNSPIAFPESPSRGRRADRARRIVLALAGLVCVGLGALGVFVPGLPTTVFLIAASWLFTKSCPWLERKLIRNRFFGPYLRFLDGDARMPVRAKVITLAVMWGFVALSCVLLAQRVPGVWLPAVVGAAAGVGTFFVVRQGRGVGAARASR